MESNGKQIISEILFESLEGFLSAELIGSIQVLSGESVVLRRLDQPLEGEQVEKAKEILTSLRGLVGQLREIEASLIAGLPPEKWTGVGA